MKSMLLTLLLTPALANSQVYKFKTFLTKLAEYNGSEYINKETNKVSILVVVNLDKNKIQTYGETPGDYDLVSHSAIETQSDGSTETSYKAIDGRGDKCNIRLVVFGPGKRKANEETGAVASLGIDYNPVLLVLYLKKDD